METKLFSLSSKINKDHYNNFIKNISNINQEIEVLGKQRMIEANLSKMIEYGFSKKEMMIEKMKGQNITFEEDLQRVDHEIQETFKVFENAKEDLSRERHLLNVERTNKLSFFNEINKERRESNAVEEKRFKSIVDLDANSKVLFKELVVLLKFIKCRIINIYELIESTANKYSGYFLNTDYFTFSLFEIDIKASSHLKMKEFWTTLKTVWIDNIESNSVSKQQL